MPATPLARGSSGSPDAFPATHLSLVARTRSADPQVRARAQDTIAAVYWGPVYAYVRLRHRLEREDAEDIVQGFFAEAVRRDLFPRFDPARARFRTYLRACVDSFAANARKAERRLKRGGGAQAVPLDIAELEGRLATDADADAMFHREWVRGVIAMSVSRLRERCVNAERLTHLALFEQYDLAPNDAPPTYAELARTLGISTTQVTNWLSAVRREFRAIVLETLRELSSDDDEFRAEARALLGVDPG